MTFRDFYVEVQERKWWMMVSSDAISAERARLPVTAAGFRTEPVWIQTQKRNPGKRIISVLETGQLPEFQVSTKFKKY